MRLQVQKIYVPQAFSSQLGKNGAVRVNAFTSKDETQYFMSVPSDMVEQWFSIVSEQLFEPAWREFYVEKDVVQREWDFRYVNNPDGAAWLDLQCHGLHRPSLPQSDHRMEVRHGEIQREGCDGFSHSLLQSRRMPWSCLSAISPSRKRSNWLRSISSGIRKGSGLQKR